jgi:MFS family permease
VDVRRGLRAVVSPLTAAVAVAAACASVVEASGNDWSAIAFADLFDLGDGAVGIGPITFTLAMLVGRMSGDHVLDRVGRDRLFVGALSLVAAGGAIVVVAPAWPVATVGLIPWGLGCAVLFPQLYGMSGRLPGVAPALGLSAMTFGARIGFVVTAPLIGSVSEQSNMRVAYAVALGASVLACAVSTRRLT